MTDSRMTSAAAQEYLELANRCLIESNRTLDREAADTLRHLASRYFKEAAASTPEIGKLYFEMKTKNAVSQAHNEAQRQHPRSRGAWRPCGLQRAPRKHNCTRGIPHP
jgi:hypothetical protein